MTHSPPNPLALVGRLWWSDGTQAVQLDEPTIRAWLERGVSSGIVVIAADADAARKIVRRIENKS